MGLRGQKLLAEQKRLQERNTVVISEIERLSEIVGMKKAMEHVGRRHFLCYTRVRDIWYRVRSVRAIKKQTETRALTMSDKSE